MYLPPPLAYPDATPDISSYGTLHLLPDEAPIALPCSHVFCSGCVLAWAAASPADSGCPTCRAPFEPAALGRHRRRGGATGAARQRQHRRRGPEYGGGRDYGQRACPSGGRATGPDGLLATGCGSDEVGERGGGRGVVERRRGDGPLFGRRGGRGGGSGGDAARGGHRRAAAARGRARARGDGGGAAGGGRPDHAARRGADLCAAGGAGRRVR